MSVCGWHQIATKAATERLEKILLRKPTINRDDRRLVTKVEREAVRAAPRRTA